MKSAQGIDAYLGKVTDALGRVDRDRIGAVVALLRDACLAGRTVYVFGNGGSSATATHLVCDLTKGLSSARGVYLRAVCLSDGVPAMMAYANDLGWEEVFRAPLRGVIGPGDVAIGISGSGRSRNVLAALAHAAQAGARTAALCGFDGGEIRDLAEVALHVPVDDMKVVEDVHLVLCHCIAKALMDEFEAPGT